MTRERLSVEGMHCSSCGMLIDSALEDLPGVASSSTSVRKARTEVSYDPEVTSVEVMATTLAVLGYTIRPV